MLDGFFNAMFGGLITKSPLVGLIVISFILTFIITIIYKYVTNQEEMKSLKDEMKGFQKQMKEFRHDPKKLMEIQKRAMEKNLKYMMHSFRPMLFTFIPIILVFGWLRNTYSEIGPIFIGLGWLWTYIIFSVIFSTIIRKILKVY